MTDYGDSARFLKQEGWTLVDRDGGRERWVGYYTNGTTRMAGGLLRTASGRRKFYVKHPTQRFYKNAENGKCQLKDAQAVEGAYLIHWSRAPKAWIDGLRRIESMM